MKLTYDENNRLVIDGELAEGNLYLVNHRQEYAIDLSGAAGEDGGAGLKITGWYCQRPTQKSRISRFIGLLPLIWRFCK